MLALVTGASGFVGSHLCELLRREGHAVRALVRPGRVPENIAGLDVEIVRGELTAPETLPAAVRGVDWVFHLAAALKGFREEDLSITVEDRQLVIRGRQGDDGSDRVYLHRGIAARAFQRSFVLADGVEVAGANLEHGLLHIDLRRQAPETVVQTIRIGRK